MTNDPVLISSTSSPGSAANARALQTADKANRGLSFPTSATSAVEDVEEVDDVDGRSNSSDITCEKGAAERSVFFIGPLKTHEAQINAWVEAIASPTSNVPFPCLE